VNAVTGASGFFGKTLEPMLAPRGPLRGLFRGASESSARWQQEGHEAVFGDLSDEAALASLVAGADVVYHLAARMAKNDPVESRRVNIEGTERLARVAGAARVRRLVFVSSISVYAATRTTDETITEEVEPVGIDLLNVYSATKYAGEEVLRSLAAQGDAPEFTIVRPTNVYGPWGRSWFLDWVRRLERVPVVVGGNVPVDLVHVDDVCAALIQAGEKPEAAGETLHIGHETITLTDYGARVADVVGLRTWRLPRPVDYLARVLVENGHRVLKGDRMSTPLTRRVRFPHEKARRVIGYRPSVSLDEGLADVGRWYREIYASERR
jgi:nucleoside-diphosphate-sugar epimerase